MGLEIDINPPDSLTRLNGVNGLTKLSCKSFLRVVLSFLPVLRTGSRAAISEFKSRVANKMKVLAWSSHSRQSKAMAHVFELKRFVWSHQRAIL